ncbi:hypothetical protein BN938_0183 [Mucinivorans hirudinis]|uniref:DUF4924 domain-containing protein n=1 Tax=Mucinivorans hirudinis TaxID=1433126 RepID=A0A060RA69_9BACT|nr:hypothetical protein BN938_0183 [Mucinivorans hirudinis]
MFIAQQKRKDNIAEYILYLWQLEDLLRALEFSPDKIYATLVASQTSLSVEQREVAFAWYMDIVQLLASEGKRDKGHLEHTEHLMGALNDLHEHLLQAPIGKRYRQTFSRLAPELRNLGEGSDIELCFRALYSVVLCRLKGVQNKKHVEDVLELISPVVALLADYYHKIERGEIDPYQEEIP